jgi:hypothetical protein
MRLEKRSDEEVANVIVAVELICSDPTTPLRRYNSVHDKKRRAMQELRRRGPQAEAVVIPLLGHELHGVRVAAAYFLLPVCPEEAIQTLEEVRANPQTPRDLLNAVSILDLYRSGNLSMI